MTTPQPTPTPTPEQPKWETIAIIGFILSFLGGIIGLVCSIIGIHRTRKYGTRGHGLAVAGVIISIISCIIQLILLQQGIL